MDWVGTCVISPSGTVHPARFYHHDEVCEMICAALGIAAGEGRDHYADHRLATRGYIKLTDEGNIYKTDYDLPWRITQAQYDAIWDMATALDEGRLADEGRMSAAGLREALAAMEVR